WWVPPGAVAPRDVPADPLDGRPAFFAVGVETEPAEELQDVERVRVVLRERVARPEAARRLEREQPSASALGRDARPLGRDGPGRVVGDLPHDLPADGGIGIEQPIDRVHAGILDMKPDSGRHQCRVGMTAARQDDTVCHAGAVGPDLALTAIVDEALGIDGIASAALFVRPSDSSTLELAAAAGIEGPALDGLVAAVRNPEHPVARSLFVDGPVFDVLPKAPGGPALRSHIPVRSSGGGQALGRLAVAPASPLGRGDRVALVELAAAAAVELARNTPADA